MSRRIEDSSSVESRSARGFLSFFFRAFLAAVTPRAEVPASTPADLESLLQVYSQVNETQRYEGEGIWSRFNILVSLHMVLFGAVAFIFSSQPPGAQALVAIVSLGGALISLWAIYVLRRLWLWHTHWKNTIQSIESQFPPCLPRPFSSRPATLQKNSAWYQSWLLAYTQPFMLLLCLLWILIAILVLQGKAFPESISPSSPDASTATDKISP